MKAFFALGLFVSLLLRWASGSKYEHWDETKARSMDGDDETAAEDPLLVNLTLVQSAVAKGAVCLDGTPPGYHLDQGFGSGANNWLIFLEGGGWCNDVETCVNRTKTRRGSSNYMPKQIPFAGILSNKPKENPSFYNWNRVRVRYCDGASFAGEGYDEVAGLYFRGQRIWSAVMDDLMSRGMHLADQAILSGSSAGGVACIFHCDDFRALFPQKTKIKCLVDAGLFLDAVDVAGGRTLRSFYEGVVKLQGVAKNLPRTCAAHIDATSCFFPQNLVANIQTPTFVLNAAYDYWQVHQSLAPSSADPRGYWKECKSDISKCNADQIQFLQGFRNQMLDAVKEFSASKENGLFINSCFTHGQIEYQDTWHGYDSPAIASKGIAQSVADWYFDRAEVKLIDCPYPCDKTCHNAVFS